MTSIRNYWLPGDKVKLVRECNPDSIDNWESRAGLEIGDVVTVRRLTGGGWGLDITESALHLDIERFDKVCDREYVNHES